VSFVPRIRVTLKHKNRFVDLLALVDSGADDCLFTLEVARELNLPLNLKHGVNRYGGIGSGHITAAFADVKLEIDNDWIFPLYAGFSDAPSVVPILGQAGFFDRLEVRFNRPEEVIELRFVERQ